MSEKTCTCHPVRRPDQPHAVDCALFVPVWRRRALERQAKYGRVAEHELGTRR